MHNYKKCHVRVRFRQLCHISEIGEVEELIATATYPRTADNAQNFRAFHRTFSLFYSEHVDNMTLNK